MSKADKQTLTSFPSFMAGTNFLGDSTDFMVVHTDLNGFFTYANRSYLDYIGSSKPPLGQSALEYVSAEDRPRILEAAKNAISLPGRAFWVEVRKPLQRVWNRSRWVFLAICDSNGTPTGLQCLGFDISDVYRQNQFREASISLLSIGLRENLQPSELLQRALDVALGVVPVAQAGSATLRGPDGCFHFVAAHGYDLSALQQVCLNPTEPLSLTAHIQARVFGQADISQFNARLDPKRRSVLLGAGRAAEIQAMLATPVVVDGIPRAYLYLDNFHSADAFDALDLRHVEGLAHHLAWLLHGTEMREELRFSRYYDAQTGLPNARSLQETLVSRPPAPRALVGLQCRSLERIRRLEGEASWAKAVRGVAKVIEADLRSEDQLAWEGGAFWLLLEGISSSAEVYAVLERLRNGAKAQLETLWPQLDFSPRVGVAFSQPGLATTEMLKAAEVALRHSRDPGTVSFFDRDLAHKSFKEDALRQALGQTLRQLPPGNAQHGPGSLLDLKQVPDFSQNHISNENSSSAGLFLHYQPIFHLVTGHLHHFEALVRWMHPKLGSVPPDQFLQIAEEEGWMQRLGNWILGTAVEQAAKWGVPVAVNLSGSQIEPDLLLQLDGLLESSELRSNYLIFEVTEKVALDDACLQTLRALAERGHPLHLDDFGSGMSSLERITKLPLSAIKLGQGFIASLGITPRKDTPEARLLRALKGLGNGLGFDIIVEGIETQAQLDFLLEEGFTLGQGYFLGRPACSADAEKLINGREILGL
ncbi:EAL domain-containing protein [Meiothermus sp. CFH 77666]|uniref:sensor domain-containing protein n=1 Tax=Meiothermus sp. CFH 77666 TaxID=2817942 RepID=UPI001FB09E42|nr:EAL domain-containing protein [Meiothermus sp. CFH 77666]